MLREGARPEVVRDDIGHANIDVTQNVYGKSWWEERVEAVTRAVEAVSGATENAEKAEAKKDQPESVSNEWVPSGDDDWNPRYNIAPTQPVLTIRQDSREPVRKLSTMRWWLVPSWAKDPSIGYKTINARAETVATTASFRSSSNRSGV
jgi:hypothetical protein